jgi:hypothetical protein
MVSTGEMLGVNSPPCKERCGLPNAFQRKSIILIWAKKLALESG